VIRRLALSLSVLLLGALLPAVAATGPSFDCARASGAMQTRICGDRELSVTEGTVAELYSALLTRAGAHSDAIAALQQAWFKRIQAICDIADLPGAGPPQNAARQTACLLDEFRGRIDSLREAPTVGSQWFSMNELLAGWVVQDALLSLPYAPNLLLAVFRSVNHGTWGELPDGSSPDAAAWGEILVLRYYEPASSENLRRMTELASHVRFGTEQDCAWLGNPCGSPSYAETEWLANRLGSSREGLVLPCKLFADHPELIAATNPRFGGTGDRFLPRASCSAFDYPWPNSIATVVDAVQPFDGDSFGRCTGTIRYAAFAWFGHEQLLAQVAPRMFLAQMQQQPFEDGNTSWAENGEPYPLEAWSYKSAANRRAFLRVAPLFARAVDDLAEIYRDRFHLSPEEANGIAYGAVRAQVGWTFGTPVSPLAVAIMRPDAKPDLASLLAGHVKITSTDEPPLSLAAGHGAAMRALLAAHEPVEATNGFGKTPLMTAAQSDDAAGVALLLAAGAEVNAQSFLPESILDNDPGTPESPGCGNLRIRHGSRSALMYAAASAGLPVIRALLAAGADVTLRDSTGLTALDYLQGRGPVPANRILNAADFATATRLLTPPAAATPRAKP
jgi:uncharacterized protein YecT (DUF1311 family)